ncbi:LuxR C-terminal-related transcriptional regulator [Dinoroseobacter sp. PD6]|uniref:response regulator transcription factor n=1 Tax=Dinoroseobacter sp. PD6 TaxID=3028384 RepID=UPI00237A0EE7|nr:LuxR C-terminal-related transcriptional regulator [Dinoroseobacter sp. PD6]MDD9717462.1 LuxR C-terminal-related transcriptional regulator [Dinoroseobacter sp. PD6]
MRTASDTVRNAIDHACDAQSALSVEARFERRLRRLTPRERQVHDALVAGEPNKNIAMDLGLAEKTVKVQRARVMQKMGMRNLADLVRAAVTRRIGAP